jgi:hypothetical protein
MPLSVGERIRNCFSGKNYRVKSIVERMVVLEADDKLSQLLTSMECIELFYGMKERKVTQPSIGGTNSVDAGSDSDQV